MTQRSIAFLFALVTISACQRSAHKDLRRANVLLITLDTTRADRIGAYGYAKAETPNLDRLAGDGVLFEHCITPSAFTLPSHSTIMTGLYPPQHGVRLNGDAALAQANETLAERLTADGYRTGAFAGAFVLDGRWGLSQGFAHYDDEFHLGKDQRLDLARVQRPANQVVDAALRWLDQKTVQPFFAWVHLYDAHTPYAPPEPFRARFAGSPYDGEIAFADSQVGRLLDWLEKQGLKDDTIVVVVGDHGEGLGSHGEGEHGFYIYDYAVRVPLLMRLPGVSGVRVAQQVRTVDIFPTLLELVTGKKTEGIEGRSLEPLIAGEKEATPRYAYSESMATNLQYGWSALYSLRSDGYKYIDAPRGELYDLAADPNESTNRLDDLRRVARELRTELTKIREEGARRAPKTEEANLDQETVRMLASLGYMSGSNVKTNDAKGLADPKDKIHLFESIGFAANLIANDDHKQAAEVLEIVLGDDPNIPQAQLLLASAYRKTGRPAEAKAILDAYLKQDAGNVRALIAMAELLADEGRHAEMVAICKRALAADDQNSRAYELMADVYMADDDHAQALPLLRKAVGIQPKLSRSRLNLAAALIVAGELVEAEQHLNAIVTEYPKFPLAHFHIALLRERQRRPLEARKEYEAELANQPRSVVARFNLGDLLLRLGDSAGAAKQMRVLIQQEPESARPYLLLGQALLTRGELGEVERLARAGLDRAREAELKALGYFLLADVYSRQGRRAELREAVANGNRYRAMM
ncbi:MAG TPA: sulfatase-like hydrolase/transferase [Thermoanaerobaculia bacterium]|jgi:arylsulfatase A-like enzyme/tetratricopeptide (TPR) repeat protein|nr:sulfatase-like hydrolase/transferase [Thermoanaerobaculia bacterium]